MTSQKANKEYDSPTPDLQILEDPAPEKERLGNENGGRDTESEWGEEIPVEWW